VASDVFLQQARVDAFLSQYNRPHQALDMKVPAEVCAVGPRVPRLGRAHLGLTTPIRFTPCVERGYRAIRFAGANRIDGDFRRRVGNYEKWRP